MRRVVRPVGKAARTAAVKTGRRIARTRPVAGTIATARRARRGARTFPRTVAQWAQRRRRTPGYGTRRISPARRHLAYLAAFYVASRGWEKFLEGTGLARWQAGRRAAAIASDGWQAFLLGTGLVDPDKGTGDMFGPRAKPLTSTSSSSPSAPAVGAPLPPPPGGGAAVPAALGRTSTMTAPGPGSNGNIFQGLMEVAHQIGGSWQPVNGNGEIAAQEMRKMIRDLPEALQALAAMYTTMARSCTDTIAMESGTADLLTGAARYMTAPIAPLLEAARAMDRPHDDDVRRMQTDNPALAAWDWARNQGYNPMS